MIHARYNTHATNAREVIRDDDSDLPATPRQWVEGTMRTLQKESPNHAYVLLTGNADLLGFRMRVAQSHARTDMTPSCFDHTVLIVEDGDGKSAYHVDMRHLPVNDVVASNAVRREADLTFLEVPWAMTPNLALVAFPVDDTDELKNAVAWLCNARLSEDLVGPMYQWLGFVWGCPGATNPLLARVGMPSAMFVEACLAAVRCDITPGVVERVATPEAIWQARFWSEYYRAPGSGRAKAKGVKTDKQNPLGYYVLKQPAAQLSWPTPDRGKPASARRKRK